jgi:phosphoglycolate phosphatase
MSIKLPKAVIFDWDNTLIDSWPMIHGAINSTMNVMGQKPWSLKRVKSDTHASMKEYFPKIFGNRWQEAGDVYVDSYKKNHLDHLCLLPNALELINFLQKQNILLFVVSNKAGNTLRAEAKKLNIDNKFFSTIGAGDAYYDKPNKAPVELALEGSDIDPEKDLVWFIGDTATDIECGINSNCQPILYGQGLDALPKDLIKRQSIAKGKEILSFNNHNEMITYLTSSQD